MLHKINTKILFWSLFVICCFLILIIKFSALTDTHISKINYLSWFPYGFELGEILYGLSLSYIVSVIFYFVVVYLPEQKKRKSAMAIIENRIDDILGMINILFTYYFYKNNVNVNNEESFKVEVEAIHKINYDKKMDFSYQYIEKSTGRTVRMGTGNYTEEMLLEDYRFRIQSNIQNIFQIPVILNVDHNLIVTLEEIRTAQFLNYGSTRKEMQQYFPLEKNTEVNIETPQFGKDLLYLYYLHNELSKYISPTKYFFKQN